MARFGRTCPFCRAYNASADARCSRCDAWLPPEALAAPLRWLRATENASTLVLGGVNIAVYALMLADAVRAGGGAFQAMWSIPASTMMRFGAMGWGAEQVEIGRYLTACFVHLSLMHIGFNMLALADLGRVAEQKVGSLRLVASYVVTGVGGFLASRLWYGPVGPPTAGASGAIFGLYGVVIASLAVRRDPLWKGVFVRVVLSSFVWYFVLHTNQAAHLGGLAVGLGVGALFELERRPWRRDAALAVFALLSAAATVGAFAWAQASPVWRRLRELEEARRDRVAPIVRPIAPARPEAPRAPEPDDP